MLKSFMVKAHVVNIILLLKLFNNSIYFNVIFNYYVFVIGEYPMIVNQQCIIVVVNYGSCNKFGFAKTAWVARGLTIDNKAAINTQVTISLNFIKITKYSWLLPSPRVELGSVMEQAFFLWYPSEGNNMSQTFEGHGHMSVVGSAPLNFKISMVIESSQYVAIAKT